MEERKYFLEGRGVHTHKENTRCDVLGYKNHALLHFSFAHSKEAVKASLIVTAIEVTF